MFSGDCQYQYPSPGLPHSSQYTKTIPTRKTVHVLDNDLRLRSITNKNSEWSRQSDINSDTPSNMHNAPGRFDELTDFFNITAGLFHQSALTLGLSTHHLASVFRLPKVNIGINMNVDQKSLEQYKVEPLKNVTLFGLIGGDETAAISINDRQQKNLPIAIGKFHTFDNNLTLGLNHRWTPHLVSTLRFGTIPQNKLWSHVEYRSPSETFELMGEYTPKYSSGIQLSYLSCLWQGINYRIDGGLDVRLTFTEKLTDIGVRLKRYSDSIVYKCDLRRPLDNYLIAIQRCFRSNFTLGVLAEKISSQQQQPIKLSLMSQWRAEDAGLNVSALASSQNELGIALAKQMRRFPLVLQTFALYSFDTHKCKCGIGLQLLL